MLHALGLGLALGPNGVPGVDFTVAIPTWNGAARLPALVERLAAETGLDALGDRGEAARWEVIVVDNASDDGTAEVARTLAPLLPPGVELRVVAEPQRGSAFARDRGVREARAPWVGCLDDDNLPAPDWIAEALRFARAHPRAGAIGSRVLADYEASPPAGFERIAAFFAITDRGPSPILCARRHLLVPPGAGLVVRRDAWLAHCTGALGLPGQTGHRRAGTGEDIEAVLRIQRGGYEVWYAPALRVTHHVAAGRLEPEALVRQLSAVGRGRFVTRMARLAPWQRPLALPCHLAVDLARWLRHVVRHGRRPSLESDPVAAAERALIVSALLSPLRSSP